METLQKEWIIAIREFAKPYYQNKDLMHDWTHIERIKLAWKHLIEKESLAHDSFIVEAALCFHGCIYSHEKEIRSFLQSLSVKDDQIEKIIQVAWESQKEEKPLTNEGLILHDAHMLEGGQYFEIIKSLITGSVRNQTLAETLKYIQNNLLRKGECYTPHGLKLYAQMKRQTSVIYNDLAKHT